MEPNEGMSSGVRTIGVEDPSSYHFAPRSENPNQLAVLPQHVESLPVNLNSGDISGKKKRGRPRKYGPDGTPVALSPMPISSSVPSSIDFSSGKRGKARLNGSESKLYKKSKSESSTGEWGPGNAAGTHFTPHIITVNAGEDVTMKIISFSQQGPRALCILSANGIISNVTLRQPDSSGGTLTYEGRFELLSLSGSFMPATESQGTRDRSGGMSVSLASPNGRVVGGGVAGLLIAAGPVQVVVGSFLPGGDDQQENKPKKRKPDFIPSPIVSPISPISTPIVEKEEPMSSNNNIRPEPTPLQQNLPSIFQRENWTNMQEPRGSATDINMPAI